MAAFDRRRPVETLQPPYHLFRRHIEDGVLPYVREHDIGTLVYSPLGSGLLTGSMDENTTFEDSDWRAQASAFQGEKFRQNLEVIERLKSFAADKGVEVSQLAIAWVLAQDGIDVAIVGARSERNIERSLAAVDVRAVGRRPRRDREDHRRRRPGHRRRARGRLLTRSPNVSGVPSQTLNVRILPSITSRPRRPVIDVP